MTDLESRFHAEWLGLVQPVEGLVVSVPVLTDAQCMRRQPLALQQQLADLAPADPDSGVRRIADLHAFLAALLDWKGLYDTGEALPDDLSLYVPEGQQTLRPTLALRHLTAPEAPSTSADDSTPASRAGAAYVALLWDLPAGLDLDKPETATGPWEYPPSAKFDRLLRACRVPIGVLTNREVVRLVYAPHGESSGHITFRVDDMASVAGRSIFDAFVMLLTAERFFGVSPEHQLPALLRDSRTRQANVTNELAEQMLDALHVLLAGFVAAAERDGSTHLDDALARDDDHTYKGLLTVLLRLVFVLYAEDRGLLPVEHPAYAEGLSALGLFEQLQRDHGEWPDSMARRFGAWPRLVALFRAVFLGVEHGDLVMPARRGELFDPHRFAFLEGWGPDGSAPIEDSDTQGRVRVPTVDDETVFRVLERLLVFQGQRLSYRALDVEQIGAVYEALMGFHVVRLTGPSLCVKGAKVWIAAAEVLAQAPAQRAAWVASTAALAKSATTKLAEALRTATTEAEVLTALEPLRLRGSVNGRVGQLVIQPGAERRRTSSHYTPPSLTAPIVRRTLEPLLAAMGAEPASERLLDLKVCDPAMGSGAFLVEACRFLADQVVAAWTREGRLDLVASTHGDVVLHARRLVAQRCLYGVDKNPLAVSLARLSLWLVTLAKDEPFTFVDHALRHGDSLVGLDLEQIRSFHWKPGAQLELARELIDTALQEALDARQRILSLAAQDDTHAKEHLLWDANDALAPVRLIADLIVGGFFSESKDKAREAERKRRLDLVVRWLDSHREPPEELVAMQKQLRERVPAFHWWIEFPEVFYGERPDPLDGDRINRVAWMDAFVGNPPFLGGSRISGFTSPEYRDWLLELHPSGAGRGDLCAQFFWRAFTLLGDNGTAGLIATNSIAQGETRDTGLLPIVNNGGRIYWADPEVQWPGEANVAVAIVHFAKGNPAEGGNKKLILAGREVRTINSYLTDRHEVAAPVALQANERLCYRGNMINGAGFVLTPEERDAFIAANPANTAVIFPYLGGEEINSTPTQTFHRYVINFGKRTLDAAGEWPELLDRVRTLVKPGRDAVKDNTGKGGHGKKYWWQFLDRCDPLMEAIAPCERVLVTAIVTKHLMFAWQPKGRVLANTLFVFALDRSTQFACLQSRLHECWARLLSSSMRTDLRYAATECFSTFPFPTAEPREIIPELEAVGERLYGLRAQYMVDATAEESKPVGLTTTYNRLKNPGVNDPRIEALRALHEEMDRAVCTAYGWEDLAARVPPFCVASAEDQRTLEAFEAEVIDRLYVLNAGRAEEETRIAREAVSGKDVQTKGQPRDSLFAPRVAQPTLFDHVDAQIVSSLSFDPSTSLALRLRQILRANDNDQVGGRIKVSPALISRFDSHIHLVPSEALDELRRRVAGASDHSVDELRGLTDDLPKVNVAASGARRAAKMPSTFRELLKHPAIPPEERKFWIRFDSSQ